MRRLASACAIVALLAAGACSRSVSRWEGTWSGRIDGSAMTPGCTTSIVDRQVILRLSQDGDRVIGTATFPTGPPAGSCTFVDSGGQPHTFTWESLSDQVGWFEARPGDGVSVEGRVSGDRLDLGGLRLRQASETEASAAIDLAPYDVSGELTVRLRRESRSPPSDA